MDKVPLTPTDDSQDEKCSSCRYWDAESADEYENEDDSDCRRYPPRHNRPGEDDHDALAWGHPRTKANDWCGEWKGKAVEKGGIAAILGKWPGDETEEEIADALARETP